MSLFVWYFGTNKRYEDVPHHTMLMGKRYKELLRRHLQAPGAGPDFSLYLHRPTATDPAMAPPGLRLLLRAEPRAAPGQRHRLGRSRTLPPTPSPRRWKTPCCPACAAPTTVARDHAAGFSGPPAVLPGAAFGLEPVLLQSAWFRPHNRSEDVDGLFMVGAGTHPGAGVPGVLMSAKALESVLPTGGMPHAASDLCRGRTPHEANAAGNARRPGGLPRADARRLQDLLRGVACAAARVRAPAAALYAFCRVADDAIDLSDDRASAPWPTCASAWTPCTPTPAPADGRPCAGLRGAPGGIPRELLDALLEGFAWDAEGRRYETLEDLHDYAARVAGTVGAMMALVMDTRTRRPWPAPATWAWPCNSPTSRATWAKTPRRPPIPAAAVAARSRHRPRRLAASSLSSAPPSPSVVQRLLQTADTLYHAPNGRGRVAARLPPGDSGRTPGVR
jgi:hypothetical protein